MCARKRFSLSSNKTLSLVRTVHTDELKSYSGLSKAGFEHETVNHGAGEYVDGDCHGNGIEGFWARLKLSIRGTQHCGHHLHPTVGTPMERTHLPLHKWFYAMHLFSVSRHGVAAKELERQLDIPYKTAWRMAHEIRKYMAKVDGEHPLDGDVEADETYIGGRTTGGKRGRGAPNKTVVFGMLERDGDVMAKVVPNVRKKTLQPPYHRIKRCRW